MTIIDIIGVLVFLTATFAYINFKFIKLPTSSGVMLIAMLLSLVLVLMQYMGIDLTHFAVSTLRQIDFHEALMNGMLSVLLFAGALNIKFEDIKKEKGFVLILSTVGLIASTALVASLLYLSLALLSIQIDFLHCLIFGALISPTDPIAVLSLLKQGGASVSIQSKFAGESLFNDGVGIVIFVILLRFILGKDPSIFEVTELFLVEAVGGLIFGAMIALIANYLMKNINNYTVEVLITLALVLGGHSLARFIGVSSPLAMVVAGLLVGNHGRTYAMSDLTREQIDNFWELLGDILNAFLFVLIGLELILVPFSFEILIASSAAIPIVLISRFICVGATVKIMRKPRDLTPHLIRLMTWGGLRGGISIALALTIPPSPSRTLIIAVTYFVVVFSVGVQSTTFSKLLKKCI